MDLGVWARRHPASSQRRMRQNSAKIRVCGNSLQGCSGNGSHMCEQAIATRVEVVSRAPPQRSTSSTVTGHFSEGTVFITRCPSCFSEGRTDECRDEGREQRADARARA